MGEETKVRDQENTLKHEWAKRLMSHFMPFRDNLPSLKLIWPLPDRDEHIIDLCGSARWSSVRKHTLTLEGYIADRKQQMHEDVIPFTTVATLSHLAYLGDDSSPKGSRVKSILAMIAFAVQATGQEPVHNHVAVSQKFHAILERLASDGVIETRQAQPIRVLMIQILEVGAVMLPRFADAFVLAFFRWLLGVSGRFSDSRHIPPKFKFTATTMEVTASQTKTTGPTKKIKSVPFVCPLTSLSGKQWWATLLRGQTELDKCGGAIKERDYMLQWASC